MPRQTKANLMAKIEAMSGFIDPSDDDFGLMLNCAVRYACGRRSYMPYAVTSFITPLLTKLSSKTLWCFDQDLTISRHDGVCGDEKIDLPTWVSFHEAVRYERSRRGEELYCGWWDNEQLKDEV